MIKVYPYEKLGNVDHGWLNARHHFSFGHYYNPQRMGFGTLRVINDDIIKAGAGFDTHPHKNMEIITYVRTGAITHRDSQGNEGRTQAGDVQVMSAGTGIFHSEFNLESEDTTLFQIWIEPKKLHVKPRWDAHQFPQKMTNDGLQLLVSGDGAAPLQIHQDARIYGGKILAETVFEQKIKYQTYIIVSKGEIEVNGTTLKQGDGAEVTKANSVKIAAISDAEVLVIDVPEK